MEKFDDYKITDDSIALKMNKEFEKMNHSLSQSFVFYTQKIIEQNIKNTNINIISTLCEIERNIIVLKKYLSNKNKIILEQKEDVILCQKKIFESEEIDKNFCVKKENGNAFVAIILSLCNLIKYYEKRIELEKDENVIRIIKNFIKEDLDIIIFITLFGA